MAMTITIQHQRSRLIPDMEQVFIGTLQEVKLESEHPFTEGVQYAFNLKAEDQWSGEPLIRETFTGDGLKEAYITLDFNIDEMKELVGWRNRAGLMFDIWNESDYRVLGVGGLDLVRPVRKRA